ncbi:chlorophyll a/b-binding protein domain-containing protein [Pavlovales sp. CCMP2436]|nr:chlorophyll a/b-binding protein domain-containing protein [Pavlovales sp. CCMP2436]
MRAVCPRHPCLAAIVSLTATGFSGASLARAPRATVSMAAKDMVGVSAPLGFFDPLGFAKEESKVAYYREAELKHGRVAMWAVLGWMTTSSGFHPLADKLGIAVGATPFADAVSMPGATWFQIGAFISVVEGFSLILAKDPKYKPGDLLGAAEYMDVDDKGWQRYQTAEINNGRLAMMGIMGLFAESLLFNHPLLGLGY